MTTELEIQALVDRETAAWDRQDAEGLASLFHPDMVWPWPPDARSHDPAAWVFPYGRYDRARWRASWEDLFRTHELVHNIRKTVRIAISAEGDGAFAVVDVQLTRHFFEGFVTLRRNTIRSVQRSSRAPSDSLCVREQPG